MTEYVLIFVQIILLFSFIILPYVSKKDVMFGVKMPSIAYNDIEVVKIRKLFLVQVFALGTIFVGVQYSNNTENILLVLLPISVIAYSVVYVNANKKMKAVKATKNYKVSEKTVIDTSFRKRQLIVPATWYLGYLAIFILGVLLAVIKYNGLPEELVVSVGTSGLVQTMPKALGIFYLLGIQAGVFLLMIGVQYIIKNAKQDISNLDTEASIERNVKFRYHFSVILYIMGLVIGLVLFSTLMYSFGIIVDKNLLITFTLLLTFLPVIAIFAYSIRNRQDGSSDSKDDDTIDKDDDEYWKLGMFYFNPKDPSMFVAKRAGIGYTINHAKWQTWVIYFVIIGLIVVAISLGG